MDAPELAPFLAAEIEAEAARRRLVHSDFTRHQGVCWSGLAPEPPAPVSRSEPAPVPNNDIEAPRAESRVPGPQFNPTLIDPNDPQAATANDANSLRAREDRLLRNPAPGARLRLPFSY